MNTSSCTLSLKSVAVRVVAAAALFLLPLGPFSWGQAYAATSGAAAQAEQTEPKLEVNHPTYVAMGQTLEVSVLVTDAKDVKYRISAADEKDAELVQKSVSYDTATGKLSATVPVSIKITAECGAGTNYTATPDGGVSYILNVKGCNLQDCSVKLSSTALAYSGKAHEHS